MSSSACSRSREGWEALTTIPRQSLESWRVGVCNHAQRPDRLSSATREGRGPGRRTDAQRLVAGNHRAALVTRRSGGGLQTSLVLVRIDGEDRHAGRGGVRGLGI